MTTAVLHFLGNLQRSLSPGSALRHPQSYKVTAVHEPFVGKQLGDCKVIQRVGQGAMSIMYKARQDITERTVAIKMLRVQLCCDPTNIKRFQREARAISRLHHPNLLNVYHVATARTGQPYIVMDFVEGTSIGDLMEMHGRMPWERAVGIFSQVCDAMEHAHLQKVIHRDLKPDNIMLVNKEGASDVVKVVDFGIVKITDESQRLSQKLTQTNEIWGSPLYMSPEQVQGNELDARSDIYSLGTVLYECVTGKLPFNGKNITELVMKQLASDPEPPSRMEPSARIPDWLERVILKAMQKDPAKRFRSMAEFRAALQSPEQKARAAAASPPSNLGAGKTDPFIGRNLDGGYQIAEFIGEGGMSFVYRAVQKDTQRVVAVKILRDELCSDDAYVKRFQREAGSLGRLSHPNVVSVFGFGAISGIQPYMIIEYLEGKSLHQWIIDHGKMSVKQALPIFIQVADVMAYAHREGVIHRDLKPHNIMLVKEGGREDRVKVVDFGIVKLDESILNVSQKLTASGEICGSPMYMSPEQILDLPLDGRTDIYSFGIVMYEMLSGRPLFGGTKITEVMNKHVKVAPQPLPLVVTDNLIPDRLDVAIRKCLEKDRENRFRTMTELQAELEAIQQRIEPLLEQAAVDRASGTQATVSPPTPAKPMVAASGSGVQDTSARLAGANRGRVIILVLAVCLLAATIAGAAIVMHNQSAPKSQDADLYDKGTDRAPTENSPSRQAPDNKSGSTKHKRHHDRRKAAGVRETDHDVMVTTEHANLHHNSGRLEDSNKPLATTN